MSGYLDKIQGLIAGEGELPVNTAKFASQKGYEVIAISLDSSNKAQLSKYCRKVYSFGPGELQKILDTLHSHEIRQVTFIGKVPKSILFKRPILDRRAISLLKSVKRLNDDKIMLVLIDELNKENIEVLDQTLFIKDLMAKKGVLTKLAPNEAQNIDIEYGFQIAKAMGELDIGQSVIVQNKMILAVEAIEGTDKAIERGAKLSDGNATVVKVSKPKQDRRFDMPTVGLRTLKTMKKHGAKILAIEAGETFIAQENEMLKFANDNKMAVVSV
jgi:DUF1009 family protein